MAQLKPTEINDTGFLQLPAGTIAQRPSSPQEGMIRYNTDLNQTEYYDGSAWRNIKDFGPKATGGDAVSNIVVGGIPYTVHYFTSTGNSTFTVTKGGDVDYLIVAGGGGAGSPGQDSSQGGNGGQGIAIDIEGAVKFYAGGAGGSIGGSLSGAGKGGLGGGADGSEEGSTPQEGTPNTGGGGASGTDVDSTFGAKGGSGIVIVRYVNYTTI